jgi:hypothetical protein
MANWNIAQLEYTNDADKGVTIAHWRVTAEDGDYSASSYGTTSFTPDASADGYVAYESLTEETVIGWVQNSLDKDEIEANLASQIEAAKAPATVAGLPWNQPAE